MRRFSERSKRNLQGVHPDLVAVMQKALQEAPLDFAVIEGLRTHSRQRELVDRGASKTMNSRHLTGHAVDIVPLDHNGNISWDWPLYHKLAPAVKKAAAELGVKIEWGGDWRSFKDGPHWQLSWKEYGKDDMKPRADMKPAQSPAANQVAEPPEPPQSAWAAFFAALAALFKRKD
jgi:peptidoglycan LD-endopeptidase CwlK